MKTTRIFLGLVMLCGTAFGTAAQTVTMRQMAAPPLRIPIQTITVTPTNGPATVTIHARTRDGKLPVGVSNIIVQRPPLYATVPSSQVLSFVGKNGDWTATNVPQGDYDVFFSNTNYVEGRPGLQTVSVREGANYFIDFMLSNGVSFKGRVLDDATGKPIASAIVQAATGPQHSFWDFYTVTDEAGNYEFSHIELSRIAGKLYIEAKTNNTFGVSITPTAAQEGNTITIPDIRLQPGGWISGRVELTTESGSNADILVAITPKIQGDWPTVERENYAFRGEEARFRIHYIPSGVYTLDAKWETNGSRTWQGVGSVSNIVVIAGMDTTNVFIPTHVVAVTNTASGRGFVIQTNAARGR